MKTKNIIYSCGHEGEISVHGSYESVHRQMERASRVKCDNCKSPIKSKLKLPELEGSEKQIRWAQSLRHTRISQLEEWGSRSATDMARMDAAIEAVMATRTSAKYWIDGREGTAQITELRDALRTEYRPI